MPARSTTTPTLSSVQVKAFLSAMTTSQGIRRVKGYVELGGAAQVARGPRAVENVDVAPGEAWLGDRSARKREHGCQARSPADEHEIARAVGPQVRETVGPVERDAVAHRDL